MYIVRTGRGEVENNLLRVAECGCGRRQWNSLSRGECLEGAAEVRENAEGVLVPFTVCTAGAMVAQGVSKMRAG
jgi:hypothetical protein